MIRLTRREKRIAIITVSLALLAILFTYAYQPFAQKKRELGDRIDDLDLQIQKSKRIAERKPEVRDEWRAIEKRLTQYSVETAIPKFLKELRSKGKQAGIAPSDIKFVRTRESGIFTEVIFELKVTTTLGCLSRFLHSLKESEGFLKVSRLKISTRTEFPGRLDLDMRISTIVASKKT